ETESPVERLVGNGSQGRMVSALQDGAARAGNTFADAVVVTSRRGHVHRFTHMNRRYLPMLVLLALVWGSSFMFIKVADRTLEPSTLILGRLGLAALVLAVFVPLTSDAGSTVAELRAHWRGLLVVGIVNTALPFWLLSWGETRIDSGLASIIQASVPIFNALIA